MIWFTQIRIISLNLKDPTNVQTKSIKSLQIIAGLEVVYLEEKLCKLKVSLLMSQRQENSL